MKAAELSELILMRLYDLAEAEGHGEFYSLDEIAAEFGVTDDAKIMSVADTLESRRLIKTLHTYGGSDGAITGEGVLLVESGGKTGALAQYRSNPSQFHALPESAPRSADSQPGPAPPAPRSSRPESPEIFIVHGHDGEAKQAVARFLEQLNLVPIILHEQASRGRTLIEKLEVHADVGFAIILLTPDDFGRARSDSQEEPRARQNVIFEMGFFFARLGRDRVCALLRDVTIPSDIAGVAYISYDRPGAWKMELSKELRAAGYEVDLNQSYAPKTVPPGNA